MTCSAGDRSFRPTVLFLGCAFAGHATRFQNLETHTKNDQRIRPIYGRQTGWKPNGAIERLPALPGRLKGTLRTAAESAAFARLPRPDVIWTSAGQNLAPFQWAQMGRLRRPLVRDLDATMQQMESMAPVYFGRPPKAGAAMALARLTDRLTWRSVTLFTPWSHWAADGLRRQGVTDARIHVLPPGIDLEQWRPVLRQPTRDRSLRLLFVGGDFERKGGPMLLDVFRTRFAGRCEIDIVTRHDVPSGPGIRVHHAEPNSALLRSLYAGADLFVLPTHADCFGIATVEAMASGLPVIVSDRGGVRDIVDDGETGWLIRPEATALAGAIERALVQRDRLLTMGRDARHVAEERFDGARNDAILVDLLLEQARRRSFARTAMLG